MYLNSQIVRNYLRIGLGLPQWKTDKITPAAIQYDLGHERTPNRTRSATNTRKVASIHEARTNGPWASHHVRLKHLHFSRLSRDFDHATEHPIVSKGYLQKLNLVPYILCKTPGCLCPILKTQGNPSADPNIENPPKVVGMFSRYTV
jgi:hypothetical protein